MNSKKNIPRAGLVELCAAARVRCQKVILAYGGYDFLHTGHIRHLRQARALGDLLVVVLAPDCEIKTCSLIRTGGASERKVTASVERVSGREPSVLVLPRRVGDSPMVYVDPVESKLVLGFRPRFNYLGEIMETACVST